MAFFFLFAPLSIYWIIPLVCCFVIASIFTKKIDVIGAIAGGIITIGMMLGSGIMGLLVLGSFFGLGSFASSWSLHEKEQLGLEQENKGKRTIVNVLANGGVAGICGFLAWLLPEQNMLWQTAMTASIAGATADTLSSELGNIYGSKYWNILTFKQDERGKDGVISLEGTFFGLIGCSFIAFIFGLFNGFSVVILFIFIIGNLGNLMDSVLGATFQQTGFLNNHTVNFGNTLFCALAVWVISLVFSF